MTENEKLMFTKYYNPSMKYTSVKKLYEEVKKNGVTLPDVKEFVQKQEATQLFKKQPRVRHYFPIVAKYKYEILQLDLVDMSNISTVNENYKYLLVGIDVFSRLAFVVPMKNKKDSTIVDSMKTILKVVTPTIINCDNGSEFISSEFKKLMKNNNITVNYVDVGDHHKLGIVDRFVRTLRDKINKYMVMYNTTKYINILSQIVHAYNHSYQTGIKSIPAEVKNSDENVIKLTNRKYNKAKQDEVKFNIGDEVRYIINRTQFEKGTLPKWTKTVHEIVSNTEHTYTLDNGKTFKYYELQLVKNNEHVTREAKEPTRETIMKDNRVRRRLKKDGINITNIVPDKRQRKQADRLAY